MVDKISKEAFDKANSEPENPNDSEPDFQEMNEDKFNQMLEALQNPVQAQKEMAVRIKHFLDHRILVEMKKNGILSENTRRWMETYNGILEKIQKALHGDKSVNLHLHKVSHSDIASKIRESDYH